MGYGMGYGIWDMGWDGVRRISEIIYIFQE
jgi:hypothetical protein